MAMVVRSVHENSEKQRWNGEGRLWKKFVRAGSYAYSTLMRLKDGESERESRKLKRK